MRNLITSLCCIVLLAGCIKNQTVNQLNEPSQQRFFTLKHPQAFKIAGNLSAAYRISLAEGRYVAAYESAEGVYYIGPSNAIRVENDKITAIAEGGIYLPNIATEPAMTWIYSKTLQRFHLGRHESVMVATAVDAMSSDIQLQWDIPKQMKETIQVVE